MAKRKYIPQKNNKATSSSTSEGGDAYYDLGFGTSFQNRDSRFINKDGSVNVERTTSGIKELYIYQWLVLMSWPQFFGVILGFYFVINCFFASLYLLNGIEYLTGVVTDETLSPFWAAFFFSVQTLTTVGYGAMSPVGFGANLIAALGALTGLMSFALATGLFFARFSKPQADIMFSENALIAPYQEGNALMFRLVNRRKNMLTNLNAQVVITWLGLNDDGNEKRFYKPLQLERNTISMLPLSWTVVHPIEEGSPLLKCDKETCAKLGMEVMIIIEGYDDTFANIIRAHYSYKYDEIIWEAKFNPTFHLNEAGTMVLDIDKLNDYQLLDAEGER